jgi:pyruvate dehydrogenase E2 component (dihydrolipoamide acetyltransferase)
MEDAGKRIIPLTMPKFGLAMTEGMVASWLKPEGAIIEAGEEVADIETSKITSAFESPAKGLLRRQVARPGEMLPVGALIGVFADADLPDAEIDAFVAEWQARFAEHAKEAGAGAPEPQLADTSIGPVRYFAAGPEDAPAVVLVHGFGGDLNNWMLVQQELADRFRTVALDLPGHGGSTKALPGPNPAELARAVAALMDALGIERAHLVGHSLGGAVAVAAAGRALSLTLVSPAGLGTEINQDYITGFIEARRGKQLRPVLEMLFADPSLVGRDMVETLLRAKRIDGVEAALRAIAAANFPEGRQSGSQREALAVLDVPVRVVWGREDAIIPAVHAEGLPPQIRVDLLDGAGHMAHLERAAEVSRAVAEQAAG